MLLEKSILWEECFLDDREWAMELLGCKGIITVTEYIENRLASMASLIRISSNGKNGFYIYGVCVAKQFRGQGLFLKILAKAEKEAKRLGGDFVCLIPANEKLFQKYFELGYTGKISPFSKNKNGNVFLDCEDFRKVILLNDGVENNGIFGLLKIISDDKKIFDNIEQLAFADFMGDA